MKTNSAVQSIFNVHSYVVQLIDDLRVNGEKNTMFLSFMCSIHTRATVEMINCSSAWWLTDVCESKYDEMHSIINSETERKRF